MTDNTSELSPTALKAFHHLTNTLLGATNWKVYDRKQGVEISTRPPEPDDLPGTDYIRGTALIKNCTIAEYNELLDTDSYEKRKKWDVNCLELDTVESDCTPQEKLAWKMTRLGYYSGNWVVSNRDFLFERNIVVIDENKVVNLSTHVEGPVNAKYVRGVLHIAAYVLEQVGTDLKVDYISRTDMSGYVPVAVVNVAILDQPVNVVRIANCIGKEAA